MPFWPAGGELIFVSQGLTTRRRSLDYNGEEAVPNFEPKTVVSNLHSSTSLLDSARNSSPQVGMVTMLHNSSNIDNVWLLVDVVVVPLLVEDEVTCLPRGGTRCEPSPCLVEEGSRCLYW